MYGYRETLDGSRFLRQMVLLLEVVDLIAGCTFLRP